MKFCIFLIVCECIVLPLQASFQIQPYSVRAISLGRAFMASADESNALFINPAGLAKMSSAEISFIYGKPYVGLADVNLGLGSMAFLVPTALGNIGAGFGAFMASGLKQERTIAVSYANSFRIFKKDIHLGVTGKHLYHNYNVGSDPLAAMDPIFSKGTSKSAISVDAGLIVPIVRPLSLGVAVRNINRPDVGLMTEDRVSREIQGGLVVDIRGIGIRASGDLLYRNTGLSGANQKQLLPFFGLEKGLYGEKIMVRLGGNPLEFTGGIGLTTGNFRLDYGVVLNRNLIQDSLGTHQIGVSFKFKGITGQ